ncbi:MAG TPA: hypothetical protein VD994_16595 [Prosthecobacter sp.]|nr:hypothetical protein [Prosthecobacter sp.]
MKRRAPLAILCLVFVFALAGSSPLLAASYAMLFYKNNYSSAVDCWVNGQYQGVIAAHSTKYMPMEGFVTSDSRWLPDGTLYQRHAYGGWSPSSPAEVVVMALPRIGQPMIYWTGTFTAPETGSYLRMYNVVKDGTPIDDLDVEFAEGMPKGEPKDLALLLKGKNFVPDPTFDGATSGGAVMAAMVEAPVSIEIDEPQNGFSTDGRVVTISGSTKGADIATVVVNVGGRSTEMPVVDGRFTGQITLTVGENEVTVTDGADGGARSKAVEVICTDKPSRLWVELAWDGPGDVDLHVFQPNGEDVCYSNTYPAGGGQLDVDNTRGYGPEHYFISAARGDNVLSGDYVIRLVHYRSDGPVQCRVTVFKDETLLDTFSCDLNGGEAAITTVSF